MRFKKWSQELMAENNTLKPRSLSFQVVAVDIIGGLPFVSVNDESHLFPLGLGDTLAGWELVSADYDAGIAEFANKNNQYVKVNAQG